MLLLDHLKGMRMIIRDCYFIAHLPRKHQTKVYMLIRTLKKLKNAIGDVEDKIKFKDCSDMDLYRYKRKLECIKKAGLVDGFSDRLADRADGVINQVIENVELRVVKNGNQKKITV